MRQVKQGGFSLIELMIAMVIGLVLLGGIVSVFSSSRKSFDLTQDLSVLQQSARYSIDEISRNIRLAGFQGCAFEGVAQSNVQARVAPTSNLFLTAIQGAEISGSTWLPAKPALLNKLNPEPLPGSDVLMLQYGSPSASTLSQAMTSRADNITLIDNTANVSAGDLAIISDCSTADLFRISTLATAANGVSLVVTHDATVNNNGNLTKPYAPSTSTIAETTQLMAFNYNTYYVANSGRTNIDGEAIYSLFSYDIKNIDDDSSATELIEGVENMQVLYGIRQADGLVQYVQADSAHYKPELIYSVQLALLIASVEGSGDNLDSKTYDLLGTAIGPGTVGGNTPAHPEDQRFRIAFSSTIKLRNRHE